MQLWKQNVQIQVANTGTGKQMVQVVVENKF